jgi:hypothetical protein
MLLNLEKTIIEKEIKNEKAKEIKRKYVPPSCGF